MDITHRLPGPLLDSNHDEKGTEHETGSCHPLATEAYFCARATIILPTDRDVEESDTGAGSYQRQ